MVLTDYITHHPGGFFVGFVPVVFQFAHGEQNTAVNRFETIAHIGQGAPDDHAHGIVKIGLLQFVFNIDGLNLFGELNHKTTSSPLKPEYQDPCCQGSGALIFLRVRPDIKRGIVAVCAAGFT